MNVPQVLKDAKHLWHAEKAQLFPAASTGVLVVLKRKPDIRGDLVKDIG